MCVCVCDGGGPPSLTLGRFLNFQDGRNLKHKAYDRNEQTDLAVK